ncbi:5'-nucleotidase [Rhodovulum sulfidophilum]|uniref:bifunctional metallophosphatase/5'-nucleotidase n=1 Tax=Rhodovulum sulfidophilum TaxID=35806 RepID=UPI0005AA744E|nr:5'-nucleotidase C-terminal domain-containing protein [Rhodovulum sulfidophilum]ANB34384.1 multifunctional 2',3'-cyclic-nucleotide 2'-phosphodiesterase/5'-nucleotidase/3'-nucleotidase [Rhodovulum sulfidophilum DSM 1374]ANB38207.1 multifunctional 2',3'-cyclic-nucleotide 2'-phosphodiesterase/5'-nucleotidase/3'-nucleotidase [Rhodovulum sulfidophilum]MCW2301981.1 5'-nucleotidase [Rhodovulum sulfidophilum]
MTMRILFPAAALALLAGTAQADFALTLLHTNDVHARLEPISKYDSDCPEEDNLAGACFGGTARLATAIAAARAEGGPMLLLDAGDQFQGTLFYSYYKGKAVAEMVNRLGYDAMAVGNHEFDDGPEGLADFAARVTMPLLMANADLSAEPLLRDAILKSTVIEVAGERIGVIGLTPQGNPDLASPGPDIVFTDPVGAAQAEADRLTAEGIDKIVLLSHSGHETDKRIAAETTGIDVIVGGHSHTLLSNTDAAAAGPYPTMLGRTAIVQAYAYGRYLGRVDLVFDDAGGLVSAGGDPILLDASVAEDAEIKARIAELAKPLEEIRQNVVAETTAPIDGDRGSCRAGECAMGNLVAEAMLDRVRSQGIQVAIQNGGGLRASIDEGPVTMGEVLTVLPFRNTLSTFHVSGATLRAALEHGLGLAEEGAGRFPQVAGLRFIWAPGAEPGQRLRKVEVKEGTDWEPLDPDKSYGLVSNNYVRNGGDGYTMFLDAREVYDFGPDLADVTAEYLARNTPYAPETDGRIAAE